MGLELAKAWVRIRGDASQLPKDINAAKPGVTTAVVGMSRHIRGVMGTLGITGAAIGFVRLAGAGEMMERKMRGSLAIMGELSDVMKRDLRRAAIETARVTMFSAAQTSEAFYFLRSAGMSAKQALVALPQVAQFAQAGMFDLSRATSLAANAQAALGMKSTNTREHLKQLTRVTDVLMKANTMADATTEQFAMSMTKKAGAAARLAGKDIEELGAVLGVFADQGTKSAAAGTAVNIVWRDMQTKAIKNKEAWEALNIAVYDDNEVMRNTADIIEDVERAFSGLTPMKQKEMLITMGLSDKSLIFTQMLIGQSKQIRKNEAYLRKLGITAAGVAAKQLTPFQKGWAMLSTVFTELGRVIMKVVGPAFYVLGIAMTAMSKGVSVAYNGIKRIIVGTLRYVGMMKEETKEAKKTKTVTEEITEGIKALGDATDDVVDKKSEVKGLTESWKEMKDVITGLTAVQINSLGAMVGHLKRIRAEMEGITWQGTLARTSGADVRKIEDPKWRRLRVEELGLEEMLQRRGGLEGLVFLLQDIAAAIEDPKLALRDLRFDLQELINRGILPAADAQKYMNKMMKESPLGEVGRRLDSMREKMFQLKMGFDKAELAKRKFSKLPGVTAADIGIFGDLQKAIASSQREMEWKEKGKELKKGLITPAEKFRETMRELEILYKSHMIFEQTFARAFQRAAGKRPGIQPGRMGMVDLGKQIQNAILKRDDPQKRIAVEAVKQSKLLKDIKARLPQKEKGMLE